MENILTHPIQTMALESEILIFACVSFDLIADIEIRPCLQDVESLQYIHNHDIWHNRLLAYE
jgi:hypothetical protein